MVGDTHCAAAGGRQAASVSLKTYNDNEQHLFLAKPDLLLDSTTVLQTLRSCWLYLFGDSSSRGLYLSLWQQLVPEDVWTDAPIIKRYGLTYVGYIDIIVNRSGHVLHLYNDLKTGRTGDAPVPDRSSKLSSPWTMLRDSGCIRITWRFATLVRYLAREPFRELGLPPSLRPDAYVMQAGAWDDDRKTPAELYARQLMLGLQSLQAAVASPVGEEDVDDARPVALIFATSPVAVRQGPENDACGSWHEFLWRSPEFRNVTSNLKLLNRVRSSAELQASLGGRCGCLSHTARAKMQRSILYHPPHIQNLLDVQHILSLLRREIWSGPRQQHASAVFEAGGKSSLQIPHGFAESCCCTPSEARPTARTLAGAPNHSLSPAEPISMWMNACRLESAAALTSVAV